jgi:hypothetical protein
MDLGFSVGKSRLIKYSIVAVLIAVAILVTEKNSYLNTVCKCLPSYFAVTFGSYAFLKIGFKLSNIKSHASEAQSLKSDVERAKKAMSGKLN